MKGKSLTILTNIVLAVLVIGISLVGFWGGSAAAVSYEDENLFYSGQESGDGVSLMFNVYEGTENVYKILDILDEHGAKATFFIGGSWADDNIDCVREIYRRGHEVGSHGYFHKDHSKMSYDENVEEIRPSCKLLEMICSDTVGLFAPPSGAFSENTLSACRDLQLKVIMWNRDTIDWRDKDSKVVYERATKDLKAGDFILMHPKDHTVKALPKILTYIGENGFKAVKISQNLGEK